MKQETLEEAIDNYVYKTSNEKNICDIVVKAIKFGAKWQQDRSYSEEEVLHILDTFWDRLDVWYNEGVDENFSLREWFNECELKKK